MKYIKTKIFKTLIFFLLLTVLLIAAGTTRASIFWSEDEIAVNREETLDDDIYILQNDAEIMGRVNGDVCALAQDFFHNGEIDGNLNICAYQADIEGMVTKSLRAVSNDIQISGQVDGNLVALGGKVNVRRNAVIGHDISCVGGRITIAGQCGGDVDISADYVVIAGDIAGNLKVKAADIQLTDKANVAGDFEYVSANEAILDEKAHVGGITKWIPPEKESGSNITTGFSFFFRFGMFLLVLVTGFAFILLFKRHTQAASDQILKAPGMSFAVGILTFAVILVGGIIFFALLIGIPLALMMFCLGVILFYIGKIYVAIALGHLVFVIFGREKGPLGVEFLIGLILLSVLFAVSILGWIVYVVTFIIGGGAAVLGYLTLNRQHRKEFAPAESAAPLSSAGSQ